MNLKFSVFTGSVALTILAFSAPAEAITFGSSYTIAGQGVFSETQIDFVGSALVSPGATGDFSIMNPIFGGGFAVAAVPNVFDI
ncbi:MAG TPA: hypothetical protein IGR64_15160, partial [Leptolyngbyaceae cyanobacterium M65_K2018_010]|nr:hypothetical protein [Leptolyngbyaceae cyanobacterium M65_K2018_010]